MTKTMQGRLLLKPSEELNEIILGVLGRALYLFPQISLFAYYFLSNHFHMMLQTPNATMLSQFMCFVNSNIAKEAGFFYRWKEKFWGRRYHLAMILDDESLVKRLKYILSQGVKHGLVVRPEQWPGVHSINALLTGQAQIGYWFNRSREARARNRGRRFDKYKYATKYRVKLSPLPCWSHLSESQRKGKCFKLLEEIRQEGEKRQEATGETPIGPAKILNKDPHDKPQSTKKSPAPFVHSATACARKAFIKAYKKFARAYGEAAILLAKGNCNVKFPAGSFPPPAPFVSFPLQCPTPMGIPP